MSSDKREFVNFKNFDGKIIHDKNLYAFPTLYVKSATGRNRHWTVYIRLIKTKSIKKNETEMTDWNLLAEDEVPIKDEYLNDDVKFPEGILAEMWNEYGQIGGKITLSKPTYTTIKHKGKANERNVFHQALVQARSEYIKKLRKGFMPLDANKSIEETLESAAAEIKQMFFPMLARKYEDFEHKIKYPVYVQPKLDGDRCMVYLDNTSKNLTYKNVVMYTRTWRLYPNNEANNSIRKALLEILISNYDEENKESIYLDGEIYVHGKSKQKISSAARNSKKNIGSNQYHIYDMFYPSYDKEPFSERTEFLYNMYKCISEDSKEIIKLVPTHLVNTEEENDKLFSKYLAKKYEGTMIRTVNGRYAKSSISQNSATRPKDLLKRKLVMDSEFEVIGYTQGERGKDVGALIWICITKAGKDFKATPTGLKLTERYELYEDCEKNFVDKYKNRMMIIEYRSMSEDDKPQHAKALGFRDIA